MDPLVTVALRRDTEAATADLAAAFVRRGTRALARIAAELPADRLAAAVGAATDTDVLFEALQDAHAIAADLPREASDPLTAAMLRGAEMKRTLLQADGGVLTATDLAAVLGITTQALGKRRMKNQVFWLDIGDGYAYPAFQIRKDGLLPGIRDVLDGFDTELTDAWTRVSFMVTGDARLAGRRPIDVLREGDIASVVRAAQGFGHDGA
jgi:hypothetical protein